MTLLIAHDFDGRDGSKLLEFGAQLVIADGNIDVLHEQLAFQGSLLRCRHFSDRRVLDVEIRNEFRTLIEVF